MDLSLDVQALVVDVLFKGVRFTLMFLFFVKTCVFVFRFIGAIASKSFRSGRHKISHEHINRLLINPNVAPETFCSRVSRRFRKRLAFISCWSGFRTQWHVVFTCWNGLGAHWHVVLVHFRDCEIRTRFLPREGVRPSSVFVKPTRW